LFERKKRITSKSKDEFSDIEKIINGTVYEIKQETILETKNTGNPMYWEFGAEIPTILQTRYESIIKINADKGRDYSFIFNGPVSVLRKGDKVKLHINCFDKKSINYPHSVYPANKHYNHYEICLAREPKNGDEIYKIICGEAGRYFITEPKNKPFKYRSY